ncbi:MAG TPA: hypothetical protein VL120_01645 [Solirubrobacteraceae bacterium]|nr:hypothetical protein [Solirubrobacteraceae bacterium]
MSRSVLTMLVLSLALPALANAASTKPVPTTGAFANLGANSVTVLGKVNPGGAATTYLFQYGPTTLYGNSSPVAAAGDGTTALAVLANLTSLAPATKYHYRLVAHNRNGTVNGADRAFKTPSQPLGLTLAATANPVPYGKPTTIAGTLSGTGNGGRQVVLQQNPFPYAAGFTTVGNPQLTAADGTFGFALLSVPLNTQYRVVLPEKPDVQSPIVGVGVAVRVSTRVTRQRVRTGGKVRFFGTVTPARPGAQIAVQKLRGTRWITVAGSITHGSKRASRYGLNVRIRRGGTYRVFVSIVDGNFVSNAGRSVKIKRIF